MSDYAKLSTTELHKLTRRRLQEQPTTRPDIEAVAAELNALAAEIVARIERVAE